MSRIVTVLFALCAIAPSPVEKPAPPPDLRTPPADAATSASGLVTKVLTRATRTQHPAESDFVHIRYAVWKASDASVVDFSRNKLPTFVAAPNSFPACARCSSP